MTSHFSRFVSLRGRAVALCLACLGPGLLGLPACGSRVHALTAENSSESSGGPPAPLPDLGSDVVVCGEPGDSAGTDGALAALAGCHIYRGSLSLGAAVTDLSPLASLRMVDGSVSSPGYNSDLETLEGLEQLQSVGEFSFFGDGLGGTSGVRNLREVKGAFRLTRLPNLTDLNGLENLRSTGTIEVSFNGVLVDIDGLSGLQRVDGDLYIDGNPELTGIGGLMALERVTGDLSIRENPKVPTSEIDALLSRVAVDGEIHVD